MKLEELYSVQEKKHQSLYKLYQLKLVQLIF